MPEVDFGFPRSRRLLKTDEFSSVFRMRVRNRTALFDLYERKTGNPARIGIVAAKRLAPRAVTRNTIRRVCREVFRVSGLSGADYIVRLRAKPMAKGEAAVTKPLKKVLRREIIQLFGTLPTAPRKKQR